MVRLVESVCAKVQLKPGSVERAREWAAELTRRADEVLASLRDQRVAVESVFLDRTGEGDFLIYHLRAESLAGAGELVQRSSHAIDAYHQKFKPENWESRTPLELLIDLENLGSRFCGPER